MSSPYHVDKDIERFYKFEEELGRGAFSVVQAATHLETGEKRAVKIIKKQAGNAKQTNMLKIEIEILRNAQHPNVIKLYEVFETRTHYYLVLKLITGGELFEKIVALHNYSEKQASTCIRQLFEGLKALHAQGFIHRDLKPENLLLESDDPESNLLITDFGLSDILNEEGLAFGAVGSPSYISPEILRFLDHNLGYGPEVDMWSTGVILYILLCGFPPFYGDTDDDIFDQIETGRVSFPSPYWDEISESSKDLIRSLLELDPNQRITAADALLHPWLKEAEQKEQNLASTVTQLKRFNARRKWRGAINSILALGRLRSISRIRD
jgi:calcium/calmodulin-dependent protein kinase I